MLKRLRRPLVVRTFSLGRTGAFRACGGRSGVGAGYGVFPFGCSGRGGTVVRTSGCGIIFEDSRIVLILQESRKKGAVRFPGRAGHGHRTASDILGLGLRHGIG